MPERQPENAPRALTSALTTKFLPGDYTGRVTPVPIPNTAVKPARADDSRKAKVGHCLDFFTTHPAFNKRGVSLLTTLVGIRRENDGQKPASRIALAGMKCSSADSVDSSAGVGEQRPINENKSGQEANGNSVSECERLLAGRR